MRARRNGCRMFAGLGSTGRAKMVAASSTSSSPAQPPLDPGVDFGFLTYHASRISLIGGRIVFLTFSILICTKGMMVQGLAEAEWKLIQFGKVSKLGNN